MTAPAAPRLTFQLPGSWLALDPRDEAEAARAVHATAAEIVGPADDAAPARRRIRAELSTAVEKARDAGAHGFFLCREIVPGLATPISLTVHAPQGMRLSPAVGTDPDAVLEALRRSLAELGYPGVGSAQRVAGPRARALRIDVVHDEIVAEDGTTAAAARLEAQYWYAVPGSKHVVLALFTTPLGELREAMLHLFDRIALAAEFAPH
ncbi:hypothetical protein [Microbacterium aureliae]